MRAQSYIIGAVLCILLFVSPSLQKNTLRVNTVFAASGEVITVTPLLGDNAVVTDSSADTISFGSQDELQIDAPGISVSGNYFKVSADSDITVHAEGNDVNIGSNQVVDVDAGFIDVLSSFSDIDVHADQGNIFVQAGADFTMHGDQVQVESTAGGILIKSEGGNVEINAGDDVSFTSAGITDIDAVDSVFVDSKNSVNFQAQGDGGEIDVDAQRSLNMLSTNSFSVQGNNIEYYASEAVDIGANDLDVLADTGALTIKSATDDVTIGAGQGLSVESSRELVAEGANDGVRLEAGPGALGTLGLNSAAGISFTATGNGDVNGVKVSANSASLTATETASVTSLHTVLDADGSLNLAGNKVTASSSTTSTYYSDNVIFSSKNTFDIKSTNADLHIKATDPASSTGGEGSISVTATGKITYTVATAFEANGGDITFKSSVNDITLAASPIFWSADRAKGVEQQLHINAVDTFKTGTNGQTKITSGLAIFDSKGSTLLQGADIALSAASNEGDTITISSTGSDVVLTSTTSTTFSPAGEFSILANNDILFTGANGISIDNSNGDVAHSGAYVANDIFFQAGTDATYTTSVDQNWAFTGPATVKSTQDSVTFNAGLELYENYTTLTTKASAAQLHGSSLVEVNTVAPPGSTDSVSVEATGDISINTVAESIVWTAAGSLTVNSAHVLDIVGQTVRLGTDGRETFSWSAASDLTSVTQRSVTDSANSVDFMGSGIELSATQVTFNSLDRGLNSVSAADTSFTGTLSNIPVNIFAAGNVEFFSLDTMTTKANSITMTGASGLYVDSSAGNVDLTASSRFTISSAHNMFFNAGNSTGDSLTITDGSTSVNTVTFQVKVDQSYLKIVNALDTLISAAGRDNTFSSDGDVLLTTKTLNINVEASTSVVGGNVDLTSGSDFSTLAGSFAIASNAVTEGERAITGVNDNILYQSTGSSMTISTVGSSFDLAGGDNGIISANTTFKVASGNTNFKSNQNKRDITVLSSGTLTQQSKNFGVIYNSANNLTITAQNYYNATGGKTAQSVAGEDQTIESNSGCLLATAAFGNVYLQAVANNLAQSQDVSVNAESTVTVRSTALPLSVSAAGHSNQREDADPATTGAGLYDTVGLTVTTEHPQGNIFVHSVNSGITVNTIQDIVIQSEAFASVEAITGETVQGSSVSVSAQDAGLGIYGARGVTATARTGSATFDSSRYASFTSEDSLRSTVTNNIDIKAEGGPIIAFTSNGRDIFFESTNGAFVAKAGGAGNDWNAQGAVSITSASNLAVSGYHGVSVATTNGNMNYTAQNGGISFNSKEETVFNSGSDLFLTANNVNINSKTAGYLTTSQGDIAYSASNSFATSATDYLNIQSKGTSQSGRDHVLLSATNTMTLTAPTITLEATESLEIGATTTPVISWSTTGDVSHPGFVLNSGGNVDISTQNVLTMNGRDLAATTTSNYKANALGQVSYTTSGAAGFTATSSAGLKIDAPNAEVRLTSTAGPVRLASQEIFRLEANGKANTDTVTFTANTGTYTTKADLVSEEHSTSLSVIANAAAPADAINFAADGTLSVTTATGGNGVITLTSTTGAESFTSGGVQSWRTTADSAPITIDNTAASTMAISTNGAGSVLTFQAASLVQARAGNGLLVNARVGDLHVHTPATTLSATNGVQTWTGAKVFMQTDYDFTGTSTTKAVQITAAGAASFLSSDTFQVLPKAGNNAGTLTLSFPAGRVEVKGGSVLYNPTTTSTLQATSPFFNSTEGFISLSSGTGAFNLNSASHSAAFVSQGPSDQLLVNSALDMTFTSARDLKLQAGSSQVNGLLSVTGQGKSVWSATGDINLTGGAAIGLDPQGALSATAGGIRVTAANIPIVAGSASFTTSRPPNVNPLQPNARSWIRFLAGQSGGAAAFTTTSAKAVVLNAAQGSVLFDSRGTTTLTAGKDIAVRTEKSASGILFDTQDDAVSHTLSLNANVFLDSESADTVRFVATGADGSVSFTSATFQAEAKSAPRQDRAGIDAHAGVISVSKVAASSLTTNGRDSDVRLTGREGLAIFNGGVAATTFTSQNSGRITVTADGGEYSPASAIPALTGVLEQRVGIDFSNGFNTIAATATNAISLQGGQDVYQTFTTINYNQVGTGSISSLGNVQLSAATVSISATGGTATGIYFRGAKGLDIVNGNGNPTVFTNFPTLSVVAGRAEAETSKLLLQTSGNQQFTSGLTFQLESDDNIAVRALNSIGVNSAGALNILASTGGHMYQSTTVAGSALNDVSIFATAGGIEINPFEMVRHTQHLALGFFQAMSPPSGTRGFPPYDLSTTRLQMDNLVAAGSSGCTYAASVGGVGAFSGDLLCYNSRNRIIQVLNALAEYGLILD